MGLRSVLIRIALLAVLMAAAVYVSIPFLEYDDSVEPFPTMTIDVEGGEEVVSKEIDYQCTISIDSKQYTLGDASATIKGRGNSTWTEPKKPYAIKFEEKVGLMGFEESKKWVLLANYKDKSFARNHLAFGIANLLACDYTPDWAFVNLYINGEYMGVYQVCEKVEVAEGRVNIRADTRDEDFGFLLELDYHAMDEGDKYFMIGDRPYTIKDPSCKGEQVDHVISVMQNAWDALKSGDWEKVRTYLDPDSFARTYVVHELFSNADVDYSSFYLNRDAGGKVCSGPVWDFDLSTGNHDSFDSVSTNRMFVAEKSVWYSSLLKYPEFREMVTWFIEDNYSAIKSLLHREHKYLASHMAEFEVDMKKWGSKNMNVFSTPLHYMVVTKWISHLDNTMGWIEDKLHNMARIYGAKSVMDPAPGQ